LSIGELRPKARSTNCIENLLRVLVARVVINDARVLDDPSAATVNSTCT
jgi:hypothetical protein